MIMITIIQQSRRGSEVKAMGSTPTDTPMNHWWRQEGHPAELLPCDSKSPILVVISEPKTKTNK